MAGHRQNGRPSTKRQEGLTARERRALTLIYPDKSVAIGLSVYADMSRRGLVMKTPWHRYVLTDAGRAAVERQTQGEMAI